MRILPLDGPWVAEKARSRCTPLLGGLGVDERRAPPERGAAADATDHRLPRVSGESRPSNAAAPQWEPRKPLAGIHAAMRADEMLERVMWRAMRSGSGW